MSPYYSPRIEDMLADPLIQAVMRADHVDAVILKQELESAAVRIAPAYRRRVLALGGARVRFGTEPRAVQEDAPPPPKERCGAHLCGW